MEKKRRMVRGQCPQCACGDVSFIPPEKMKEKYTGPKEEIKFRVRAAARRSRENLKQDEK